MTGRGGHGAGGRHRRGPAAQGGQLPGQYGRRGSGRTRGGDRVRPGDQQAWSGRRIERHQPARIGQQGRRGGRDRVGGVEMLLDAHGGVHLPDRGVRLVEQPPAGLQFQDPQHRLLDARLRQLARLHGRPHAAVREVQVRRVQQLVAARQQGQDRDAVVPVLLADAGHVQGVGDHHPLEAEAFAQQTGDDRPGEGRRVPRGIERGEDDVRRHDGVHAGLHRGPEGRLVQLLPGGPGVPHHRQPDMAVGLGVPVAREVLGGGGDPDPLVAADLGGDQLRHGVRVGAEGPHADHRIGRVDVHIGHRRVVLPDAHGGQLGARDARRPQGVGGRAGRTERHRPREQGRGLADPGDGAVLLVGGEQQGDPGAGGQGGLLEADRQRGDLLRAAGVVGPGEVDDPAEVVAGDQLGGGAHPERRQVLLGVRRIGVGRRMPVGP